MRPLFLALLAIATLLPATPLLANIAPRSGHYSGVHGIYQIKFHLGHGAVTGFQLIVGGHNHSLHEIHQQQTANHHFTANNLHFVVEGHWSQNNVVQCRIVPLTGKDKNKATHLAVFFTH